LKEFQKDKRKFTEKNSQKMKITKKERKNGSERKIKKAN
jgi:hypothetical protein